ncbi:MAG: hypothetical protein JHD32_09820 [Sphingobium sp.]|nr:hypothetical protein [Sphingobium sp.]
MAGSHVSACTLIPQRKPVSFRAGVCEQRIRQFIDFANVAHAKNDKEVEAWQDETGINPRYEGEYDLSLTTLRFSDGKVDPKPLRIGEIELVRQLNNRATYVFTLKRHQYFAADDEGCNGMFVHDEYFGDTITAYLATFENNRFMMFREFPEWYVNG